MDRYYESGTIPWVKSGELRETVINNTEEHVTEVALRETSVKLVPAGAILLAMYGATVGRLGVLGVPATTNQAVCHIIPNPEVAEVRYLFHAIRNQVSNLIARGVGGAQPNISQGIIKEIALPLAPLTEQRRIAGMLDRAEALRAKRHAALVQLDTLAQAIFLDVFGDPVTNPKGWPKQHLGDLLAAIRNGANAEQRTEPNGWAITRIETISDGTINPSRVRWIEPDDSLLEDFQLEPGDILFSHINSVEHIAKTALYSGQPSRLIHGINLLRLRLRRSFVEPVWLLFLLRHPAVRTHFRTRCKRAVNQASLNQPDIKSLETYLPPLSLQQEFVRRIATVENLRLTHRASLAELDALFASLQHRAFRGEL